jgi:septum formation protein
MKKIILASGSPRRKQLLEWAGISFEVRVSDSEENFPEDLAPNEVAIHIAEDKAVAVQNILEEPNKNAYTILAADTIVVLNQKIIGKPASPEDAIKILTELSGKTHEVITGVCILQNDKKIVFAEKTEVTFHPLSLSQIGYYVENYQPFDKAGAYAIQEWIGLIGIQSINGDFYNVMGLPVSKVVRELNKL